MALRLRRGTNAERLTVTPESGEIIYVTDSKKLYVGDGSTVGGNLVSGVNNIVDDSTPQLGGDLDLNGNNITGNGNISINGTITATGNINLGDGAGGDVISVGGDVSGNLIPTNDESFTLGTPSKRWQALWASSAVIDGQIDAVAVNADIIADDSTVAFRASTGEFTGTLTGTLIGNTIGDVVGSVFADDSTLLVDSVSSTLQGSFQGVLDTTGTAINQIYTDGIRTNILNFRKYDGTKSVPTEPGDFDRQGISFSSFNTGAGDYVDEALIFSYHQTAGGGYLGISPVASDNTTFFDTAIEIDGNAQKLIVAAKKGSTFDGPISPGVYANDAARDSAVPSPTAGMIIFNQRDDSTGVPQFQGYDGSVWVDLH